MTTRCAYLVVLLSFLVLPRHVAGGAETGGALVFRDARVFDGAQASKGALLIEGEVDAGLPYAWAGAIFFPGEAPMAPADLSSKQQVSFWAKADGRTYSVMLFVPSKFYAPIIQTFVPGAEWQQFTFKQAQFDGYDAHDLAGLFIGAGLPAGKFALRIDDVRFQ